MTHGLGVQSCRLEEGKIWIKRAGTCGIASVAHFWSRAAAGLLRLACFWRARESPEILIYAADLLLLPESARQIEEVSQLMFLFTVLGAGWALRWAPSSTPASSLPGCARGAGGAFCATGA